MRLFNTYRREDPSRPAWRRLEYQVSSVVQFAWTILRLRPLIVHVKAASYVNFYQSALYATVARILGRRVTLQLHAGDFPEFHRRAGRMQQAMIRAALRVPNSLIALSRGWADYFRDLSGAKVIAVIPNALVTGEYCSANSNRARFGISDERVALLFVGTRSRAADASKGLDVLVEAVARARVRYPELLLVVAGVASESEVLSPMLGPEGRAWLSVGVVGPEHKPILYKSVDIFALPSRFENMPNTLLEAMAAGLPSISTPVGAVSEMIEEGETGFLVPVGDISVLAERIECLVADSALRRQLGKRAAAVAAESFDFQILERRMLTEYQRLAPGLEIADQNRVLD